MWAMVGAAYKAQKNLVRWPLSLTHRALARFAGAKPDATINREIYRRYQAILERDLANAQAGYYPTSLIFGPDPLRYTRALPELLRQLPGTVRRARENRYDDVPADDSYPRYYQRNFHWQTDGYFSERSAKVYDLQVDWVFVGLTDVMRRQVIPPIAREARDQPLSVLDVACGTGRTLEALTRALPNAKLVGTDLSPAYAAYAQKTLGERAVIRAENAESMAFADGEFDVVTCTYLFHELPKDARRNVLREMHRILKPGGLLVIQDSAQFSDSEAIAAALVRFAQRFHEPYYKGYLKDDLATAIAETGFEVESDEVHFVAKVVTARKPRTSS